MAMRRPRIKAAINLSGPKRKAKPSSKGAVVADGERKTLKDNEVINEGLQQDVCKSYQEKNFKTTLQNCDDSNENANILAETETETTPFADELIESVVNDIVPGNVLKSEIQIDNESFKCPPNMEYANAALPSTTTADDVFYTDIEESALQMTDAKSSIGMCPMSPSKLQQQQQRPRIKPTPVFGQRRNSLLGTTPEEALGPASFDFAVPQRRERHFSASQSQFASMPPIINIASPQHTNVQSPHKGIINMQRIRTESSCSAFSDSYLGTPTKMRKLDEPNHRALARRDFEARFTNGQPEKSNMKMFDLIYYNPISNPMDVKQNIKKIKTENETKEDIDLKPALPTKIEQPTVQQESNAMPVPQLKLNANGELVLDDKSLEIETTAELEARKVLANSSLIFLDENTGMNGFYKRHKRTKEWMPDETIKFYRCLQTIGSDFSAMVPLFKNRTRRDMKLKFKKEERCNGALIRKALLYPNTFNLDVLKEQLQAEERERDEIEQKFKEYTAREAVKMVKKIQCRTSISARMLQHGDEVYENENVPTKALKKRCKKKQTVEDNTVKKEAATATELGDTAPPTAKRKRCKKTKTIPVDSSTPAVKIENKTTNKTDYIDPQELQQEFTELLETADIGFPNENQQKFYENMQAEIITTTKNEATIITNSTPVIFADFDGNYTNITYENLENQNDATVLPTNDTVTIPMKNVMKMESIPAKTPTPKENLTQWSTNESTTIKQEEICSANANIEETPPPSPYARSLTDFDGNAIQLILKELSEGTLVLVSTLDRDEPEKAIHEIFMADKETGNLCDKPLDIPEVIINSILAVMNE